MVKIFHTMAGSGNCGMAIFGSNGISPGWKPGAFGRGRPPTDKIKKYPNKYRAPYKYYAIY
jgi:hypothetical protein